MFVTIFNTDAHPCETAICPNGTRCEDYLALLSASHPVVLIIKDAH